jgi:hypothetical protein
LPQLVKKEELALATANIQSLNAMSRVLGGILGAFLASFLPLWQLASLSIIATLISLICIALIRADFKVLHLDVEDKKYDFKKWLEDLKEGFKYLLLLVLVVIFMFINFCAAPIMIAAETLVIRDLKLPATYLGYLTAAFSAGIILSMGCYQFVSTRIKQPHYMFVLFICFSLELITIGMCKSYWVTLPFFFALGITNGLVTIPLESHLIAAIRNEYMGRVMSLLDFVFGGIFPIAIATAGILLDHFSSYNLLLFCGIGLLVFSPLFHFNKVLGQYLRQPTSRVASWVNRLYFKVIV